MSQRDAAAGGAFHIPSLDGLRAVSILIVFLSHAGLHKFFPGLFGVTVFFFLSGYLITTLLRLEQEQTGRVSLGQFYLRRTLRIFPPFYLILLAVVVLVQSGALKGEFSWRAVGAQGLYLSNYYEIFVGGGQPPGTEVFWSLSVEEHFYLLFPLLFIVLQRWVPQRRHQFQVLLLLSAGVLAWRVALVYGFHVVPLDAPTNHFPRTCHATDTRLDALLFGCMLAVWGNPVLDPTRFSRRFWLYGALPAGLVLLGASFAIRGAGFRETLRYTVQGLALFPVFIAAIRGTDSWLYRGLNWSWMRRLGVLSYSFYLTHSIIIACLLQWLPAPAAASPRGRIAWLVGRGVLAFLASWGVSALIYRAVEKPCARLRKRLSRVVQPVAAAPAASPQGVSPALPKGLAASA